MSSKKNKNGNKKTASTNGSQDKTPAKRSQTKQTASKKQSQTKQAQSKQVPPKKPNKGLIVAAVVGVLIIGLVIISGGLGAKKATALTPTPEEAKYLGRYLPAGYVEPTVGEGGPVTQDIPMAQIPAEQTDAALTIPLSEVVSKRNVGFSYTKADGTPVALIAFVKPSGKLSVAVSFCVPCKGTSHTMTTDGNMTCDACGTKRDIETAVGISGACKLYPMDELPVTIDGDTITIEKGVLENWTEQPSDRQVG